MRERLPVVVALHGRVQGVHRYALLAAAQINNTVGDNAEQPALERARGVVTVEVMPGPDIGVLGHVLGIRCIAGQAIGQVISAALAAPEQ